jgi:hypothetical protein
MFRNVLQCDLVEFHRGFGGTYFLCLQESLYPKEARSKPLAAHYPSLSRSLYLSLYIHKYVIGKRQRRAQLQYIIEEIRK